MYARSAQLFAEHKQYTFCSWPGICKPEMFSPAAFCSPELDVAQRIFKLSFNRQSSCYTDAKTAPASCHRHEKDTSGSDTSTSGIAGSFHPSTKPDPMTYLLLRFHCLPPELVFKIADDVVREATATLYTGCRACRWQDWSRCSCRHWQKTFCVLATLDTPLGLYVRQRGKDLARSWGYSPVDACGPYAAGYRFSGKVIGGLRMGDFLFDDEKLTALPEPEPDHEVLTTPEVTVEPVHWAPSKGQKLAGISIDTKARSQATPGSKGFDYFDKKSPSSSAPLTPRGSKRSSTSSKRFSLESLKPSARTIFEMVSANASKFKRQSFMSASSNSSFRYKRGSRRSSAYTDSSLDGRTLCISGKGVYI